MADVDVNDARLALPIIAQRLSGAAATLRARRISGLWVFGSAARGEAGVNSDIDLFAEFDPLIPVSLVTLASLRADLTDLLGTPADLVERSCLHPAVRATAERDAVRVL